MIKKAMEKKECKRNFYHDGKIIKKSDSIEEYGEKVEKIKHYISCLLYTSPSVRYRGVLPAGVASPHQQRLVRAVAFRFARRRHVLPCLCKRTDSLQDVYKRQFI